MSGSWDFLTNQNFMPHGHCYFWDPVILTLHAGSDVLIALAYFSIPVALYTLIRRRKDLDFQWVYVLFAIFIFACGATHLMEVINIWYPAYFTAGLIKLGTAIASVTTAVVLWPLIPKAAGLSSPHQLSAANRALQAEVSHRKAAEEEIRALNADLEKRVAEATEHMQRALDDRNEALERERAARESAERANRTKEEFLAVLSHELRTPLNAILGWVHLLKRGGPSAERVAEATRVIERNARQQARIIEDLLDISRIVAGKVELAFRSVELAAIIDEVLESIRPVSEGKRLLLKVDYAADLVPVRADPARLRQIVWNLVSNSVKFTPEDGSVRIAVTRHGSLVEIAVVDTGKGIAPEFLPHIFDRFRQEDASFSRQHGGLGLGLSITRHLTERHGGSIRAESEGLGRGATMSVTIPVWGNAEFTPAVNADATTPLHSHDAITGANIIVVDDDPDARALLSRILVEVGARVQTAGSAREALALVRTVIPDLVISDIGMPEQDGLEFIRRVRMLGAGSGGDVPAIAVTAFARVEDQRQALDAGFQLHLSKPISPDELLTHVNSILQKRSAPEGPPLVSDPAL